MSEDDQPTRNELIEARDQLKEQLARVSSPMNGKDYNPQLVAKLEAMIAELDECLAEPVTDNA